MKLQGSEVQDHETLQSQIGKIAENRLSLSGLEIFHGRHLTVFRKTNSLLLRAKPRATSMPYCSPRCFAVQQSEMIQLSNINDGSNFSASVRATPVVAKFS